MSQDLNTNTGPSTGSPPPSPSHRSEPETLSFGGSSSVPSSSNVSTAVSKSANGQDVDPKILHASINDADPLLVRWSSHVEGPFISKLDEHQPHWTGIDFARRGTREYWWMNPVRVMIYLPGSVMVADANADGATTTTDEAKEKEEGEEQQQHVTVPTVTRSDIKDLEKTLQKVALENLGGAWIGVLGDEYNGAEQQEGNGVEVDGIYQIEIRILGEEVCIPSRDTHQQTSTQQTFLR